MCLTAASAECFFSPKVKFVNKYEKFLHVIESSPGIKWIYDLYSFQSVFCLLCMRVYTHI